MLKTDYQKQNDLMKVQIEAQAQGMEDTKKQVEETQKQVDDSRKQVEMLKASALCKCKWASCQGIGSGHLHACILCLHAGLLLAQGVKGVKLCRLAPAGLPCRAGWTPLGLRCVGSCARERGSKSQRLTCEGLVYHTRKMAPRRNG